MQCFTLLSKGKTSNSVTNQGATLPPPKLPVSSFVQLLPISLSHALILCEMFPTHDYKKQTNTVTENEWDWDANISPAADSASLLPHETLSALDSNKQPAHAWYQYLRYTRQAVSCHTGQGYLGLLLLQSSLQLTFIFSLEASKLFHMTNFQCFHLFKKLFLALLCLITATPGIKCGTGNHHHPQISGNLLFYFDGLLYSIQCPPNPYLTLHLLSMKSSQG